MQLIKVHLEHSNKTLAKAERRYRRLLIQVVQHLQGGRRKFSFTAKHFDGLRGVCARVVISILIRSKTSPSPEQPLN
jgi:hypothetical protein